VPAIGRGAAGSEPCGPCALLVRGHGLLQVVQERAVRRVLADQQIDPRVDFGRTDRESCRRSRAAARVCRKPVCLS